MIILTVAAMSVILFLLWNHVYTKCFGECYECDTVTVAYSIAIIFLVAVLIYFTQ